MSYIDGDSKLFGGDTMEYVPHPIVGAIDHNPPQGVMLLDEKK